MAPLSSTSTSTPRSPAAPASAPFLLIRSTMTRKTQPKPMLKNHWADDHLMEASNVLELAAVKEDADDDDDVAPLTLPQLEPALG